MTPNSRKEFMRNVVRVFWRILPCDRIPSDSVHCCIPHYPFEIIIRMLLMEIGKTSFKPVRAWLDEVSNQH